MSGSGSLEGSFKTSCEQMSIEWQIPRWRILFADDTVVLESPDFNFCGSRWSLEMWPNDEDIDCISLYLLKKDAGPPLIIHLTLGIRGRDGVENKIREKNRFLNSDNTLAIPEFLPRLKLKRDESRLMPNNLLTIVCKLRRVASSAPRARQEDTVSNIPPGLESLSCDWGGLLRDGSFADVELRCGERVLRAHRSVLAARSEVFAAMFRSDMLESRTGVVHIPDLDADVADAFVHYLYMGRLFERVPDPMVPQLYEAADKYGVDTLKDACRNLMIRSLAESNCLGVLDLADAHHDVGLKKAALAFICGHKWIKETEAWWKRAERFSNLAFELFLKYARGKE